MSNPGVVVQWEETVLLRFFAIGSLFVLLIALVAFSGGKALAQSGKQTSGQHIYPGVTWDRYGRSVPNNWNLNTLRQAKNFSEDIYSAALVVVLDGKILMSRGEVNEKYKVHSIRKSFLNALYGIHVANGKIDLNKTLAQLGIDEDTPLTPAEKQARVFELLQSRCGVYIEANYQSKRKKKAMPARGAHPPGKFFFYNNWCFNALGTIFQKKTGKDIFEEFKVRIATPLQMQHYIVPDDGEYVKDDSFSIHPAYTFRMSALDMARFGLLYMRGGKWKDKQILSTKWINDSVTPYSSSEETKRRGRGYGYLWWVRTSGYRKTLGLFSARGSGGHSIDVFPKAKLIIVHRVDTDVPRRQRRYNRRCRNYLVNLILSANKNLDHPWGSTGRSPSRRCPSLRP